MAKFEPYDQAIPTKVRQIEIHISSTLEPVYSDAGDFGDKELIGENETETLFAFADVEDQDGNIVWNHTANYQELMNLGLLTAEQLQTIQAFIRAFRDSVELKVIP